MIAAEQKWPIEFVEKYKAKGYWRGETFGAMLRQRAQQYGKCTAVVAQDGQQMTYAQLDEQADTIARGLLELGLKKGDRVIVHMPSIPQFFPIVFALFRAGMLPVYALTAHRITEIQHFAHSSQACAYVIAGEFEGFDYCKLAADLQAEVPRIKNVIVVGAINDANLSKNGFVTYDDLHQKGKTSPLTPQENDPQEVAFMQISGGSTGPSKLIPRTHDDYIYTLRESNRICNVTARSIYLCALPISHNFTMSSPGTLGVLYAGGKIVLMTSSSPENAFALIAREKVTITGLVPPLLLVWLQAAEKNTHNISSLEVLLVGGAKLMPEVAKRVRPVLGTQLQQVFGMAEGLVNYTRLDDPDDVVINTQGRPICPDDEILLLDDKGNPVPQGEPGYLLTRGPYTIHAYHNNPTANARSFTEDGFYRTGDIALMTPEGNLEVHGRANDHINRAGEKISAEEIEDHLLANPKVFDAAVVSIPDQYLGERSCAFIIAKGEKPRSAEIKQWIRTRGLAEFKVPDQVVFVEKFIETAVGKTSRKELRAALRAQLQNDQKNNTTFQ